MALDLIRDLIVNKSISVTDKGLNLFGKIHNLILPARSFSILLQEIGEEKGEDYLFDLGYLAGDDNSKELIGKLNINVKVPLVGLKAVQPLLEVIGFGRYKPLKFNPSKNIGIIHVTDNPVIEHSKKMYGAKSKACSFYRGIYSGHAVNEVGFSECHFEESQCICKGSDFCEWYNGIELKNEN